jgi:Leucine-rich repeat (LRR) protein
MKASIFVLIIFLLASVNTVYSQELSSPYRVGSSETYIVAYSTTPSLNEIIRKYPKASSMKLVNYPFDPQRDSLFYTMKNLEQVSLCNYPQSTIDAVLKNMSSLQNIRGLAIIDSLLYDFPVALRHFSHLNYLDIEDARFHSIPDLGNLTVDTLQLKNDSIVSFAQNFCRQSQVSTLWISGSKYTFIPKGVEKMAELKNLWINSGHPLALEDILQRIAKDNKLESFYFNTTAISSVPESIRKLKNLKGLDLSGNRKLSSLPDAIQGLKKLQKLDIALCGFETFPRILFKLKNLQSVALEENKIQDIGCTFENSTIKEISFFNNPLSEESRVLIENSIPPGIKVVYPYEDRQLKDRYAGNPRIPRALQITAMATTSLNDVIRRRPTVESIEFNNYPFNIKKDSLFFLMKNLSHVSFTNYSEEHLNSILEMVSSKKSIRSISINDSLLTSFPTSLHYFNHLDYLNLENVRFTSIPHQPESSLLTVDTLSLTSDSIVFIFPAFANQLKIKSLDIYDSKLNDFPGGFEEMKDLKGIRLYSFPANTLEAVLKRIPEDNQIEYFGWIHSAIRSIPPSINKLKNLKRLSFRADTLLTSLPNEIENLSTLEVCDFYQCGFREFPKILFTLKNLQVVILGANKIQDIGCTFENTTIKILILLGNPLSADSRKILEKTVPSTTKIDPKRR